MDKGPLTLPWWLHLALPALITWQPSNTLRYSNRRSSCHCCPKYYTKFNYATDCNYRYWRRQAWWWVQELAAPFPSSAGRGYKLPISTNLFVLSFSALPGENTQHCVWQGEVIPPIPPVVGACCTLCFTPLAAFLLNSLPVVILESISLLCYNVSRYGAASERLSASNHAGFSGY